MKRFALLIIPILFNIYCLKAQADTGIEFNYVQQPNSTTSNFPPVNSANQYTSNVLRRVPLSSLLGNSPIPFEASIPPSGANISLIGSEWIIKKLWLASPGFSLDFDGCLSGGAPQSGNQAEKAGCSVSAAQVIHITPDERAVNKNSMLTLIISSGEGNSEKRKLLLVRLLKGQSENYVAYNYEIYDNYNSANNLSRKLSPIEFIKEWRLYNSGLERALSNKLLEKNGVLHSKIQDFLAYFKQGADVANAASQAGMDLQIINKIRQLGLN